MVSLTTRVGKSILDVVSHRGLKRWEKKKMREELVQKYLYKMTVYNLLYVVDVPLLAVYQI